MPSFARLRVLAGIAALVGLALAVVVQAFALGGVELQDRFPAVWALHAACLATLGLAVLAVRQAMGGRRDPGAYWRVVPIWGHVLIYAAILYGVATFALGTEAAPGVPVEADSRYFLENHGTRVEVSEADYHAARALDLQRFSAIWISFFLASAVLLLAARKADAPRDIAGR